MRLGFEKGGPHHAMKKGVTPYYYGPKNWSITVAIINDDRQFS